MTREEAQAARLAAFVDQVLLGRDAYPPAGWHELHGETGRSALIWSLCHWRMQRNGRATLVLPVADCYDYTEIVHRNQIDPRLVICTRRNHDLLGFAAWWMQSGLVGQVILEGLGFLLGAGRVSDEMKHMLGPTEQLYTLTALADTHDVALYTTSYSVPALGSEVIQNHSLGGSLLLDLTFRRRLFLTFDGVRFQAGKTVGEYLTVVNSLNILQRRARFEIQYAQGPIRFRLTQTNSEER